MFIKPLNITRTELAKKLEVPGTLLDEIVSGHRAITPDTALRFLQVFGMSADFWLGLQQDWDLWRAMKSPKALEIRQLRAVNLKTESPEKLVVSN